MTSPINYPGKIKITCTTARPKPVGTDEALVIGCSDQVKSDLRIYKPKTNDVIACNDAGCYYQQPIRHWVAVHAALFTQWENLRKFRKFEGFYHTHTIKYGTFGGHAHFVWEIEKFGGSVAMLATIVALEMGYNRVVLAGCPMDDSPHFWDLCLDERPKLALDGPSIRDCWTLAKDVYFKDRVRSLSGWTRELLGGP